MGKTHQTTGSGRRRANDKSHHQATKPPFPPSTHKHTTSKDYQHVPAACLNGGTSICDGKTCPIMSRFRRCSSLKMLWMQRQIEKLAIVSKISPSPGSKSARSTSIAKVAQITRLEVAEQIVALCHGTMRNRGSCADHICGVPGHWSSRSRSWTSLCHSTVPQTMEEIAVAIQRVLQEGIQNETWFRESISQCRGPWRKSRLWSPCHVCRIIQENQPSRRACREIPPCACPTVSALPETTRQHHHHHTTQAVRVDFLLHFA